MAHSSACIAEFPGLKLSGLQSKTQGPNQRATVGVLQSYSCHFRFPTLQQRCMIRTVWTVWSKFLVKANTLQKDMLQEEEPRWFKNSYMETYGDIGYIDSSHGHLDIGVMVAPLGFSGQASRCVAESRQRSVGIACIHADFQGWSEVCQSLSPLLPLGESWLLLFEVIALRNPTQDSAKKDQPVHDFNWQPIPGVVLTRWLSRLSGSIPLSRRYSRGACCQLKCWSKRTQKMWLVTKWCSRH